MGLLQREIVDVTGLSRAYVSELLIDPTGEGARERKERYRRPCPNCGRLMEGSDGRGVKAPKVCRVCNTFDQQEAMEAKRGTGWREKQVLAYCITPRRFTEIAEACGITANHTARMLDRLLRYRKIERIRRGVYLTRLSA